MLISDAPDVSLDRIEVRSTVPGADHGGGGNVATRNNRFAGHQLAGLHHDRVYVENFDWAVWFEVPGFRGRLAGGVHLQPGSHIKGSCS